VEAKSAFNVQKTIRGETNPMIVETAAEKGKTRISEKNGSADDRIIGEKKCFWIFAVEYEQSRDEEGS